MTVGETQAAPRDAQAKTRARQQFEKWALSYDRSKLNELIFYPCIRACQEEILRWQARRGAQSFAALDVGCGTGSLLAILSRDPLATRLVGLDYSPTMIAHAQEKFAQVRTTAELEAVVGDAEHLPFDEASFDVVTCCNSFHHYPNQAEAIRGFHRVLKPGGLLLLLDGFRDNVIGWFVFDVCVTSIERDVYHVPWSEMRAMIRAAGFRDLRQRKMNVFAPVLVNAAQR